MSQRKLISAKASQIDQENILFESIAANLISPPKDLMEFNNRIIVIQQWLEKSVKSTRLEFLSNDALFLLQNLTNVYTNIREYFSEKDQTAFNMARKSLEKYRDFKDTLQVNPLVQADLLHEKDRILKSMRSEIRNVLKAYSLMDYRNYCNQVDAVFAELLKSNPNNTVVKKIKNFWDEGNNLSALPADILGNMMIEILSNLKHYQTLMEKELIKNQNYLIELYKRISHFISRNDKRISILQEIIQNLINNLESILEIETNKLVQAMIQRIKLLQIMSPTVLKMIRDVQSARRIENDWPLEDDVFLTIINALKENKLLNRKFYTTINGESPPARRSLTASLILKFNQFIVDNGNDAQKHQLFLLYDIENNHAAYIPIAASKKEITYYYINNNFLDKKIEFVFSTDFCNTEKFHISGQPLFSSEFKLQDIYSNNETWPHFILPPNISHRIKNKSFDYFAEEPYQAMFVKTIYEKTAKLNKGDNLNIDNLSNIVFCELIKEIISKEINELRVEKNKNTEYTNYILRQVENILINNYTNDKCRKLPVKHSDIMHDASNIFKIVTYANENSFVKIESEPSFKNVIQLFQKNGTEKRLEDAIQKRFMLIANRIYLANGNSDVNFCIQATSDYINETISWMNAMIEEAEEFGYSQIKAHELLGNFLVDTIDIFLNNKIDIGTLTESIALSRLKYYKIIANEQGKNFSNQYFIDLKDQELFIKQLSNIDELQFLDNNFTMHDLCTRAFTKAIGHIVELQSGINITNDYFKFQHQLTNKPLKHEDISKIVGSESFSHHLEGIINVNAVEFFNDPLLICSFLDIALQLKNTWSEKLNFNETVICRSLKYVQAIRRYSDLVFFEAIDNGCTNNTANEHKTKFIKKATNLVLSSTLYADQTNEIDQYNIDLVYNKLRLNSLIEITSENLITASHACTSEIKQEFKLLVKNRIHHLSNWRKNESVWLNTIARTKCDIIVKYKLRDLFINEINRIRLSVKNTEKSCFSFVSKSKSESKIIALNQKVRMLEASSSVTEVESLLTNALKESAITRSRHVLDIFSLFGSTTKNDLIKFKKELHNKIKIV